MCFDCILLSNFILFFFIWFCVFIVSLSTSIHSLSIFFVFCFLFFVESIVLNYSLIYVIFFIYSSANLLVFCLSIVFALLFCFFFINYIRRWNVNFIFVNIRRFISYHLISSASIYIMFNIGYFVSFNSFFSFLSS